MPPRFEGKFGIPGSHEVDSQLTSSLYRLHETITPQYVEKLTEDTTNLLAEQGLILSPLQRTTLHLKIARHLEKNTDFPMMSCIDALVETPRFLDSDRGGIEKLLDLHHMKTLQKIAERRKQIALRQDDEGYNPNENLFETSSGKYYLTRLLNKAHLEEESDELLHCVGNNDYYLKRIIKGDIEIFSFRNKANDDSLFTIEYDKKLGDFLQVRGYDDETPDWNKEEDLIEALETISTTIDDEGKQRVVKSQALEDAKLFTLFEKKQDEGTSFAPEELRLLYEVDRRLVNFNRGERDYRIKKIQESRHHVKDEDIITMCNCQKEYIAKDFLDINEQTQVFCYINKEEQRLNILDFREEDNKTTLEMLVQLQEYVKATGNFIRPDMSFNGGIIRLQIDIKTEEALKTWKTAQKAYEHADEERSHIAPELHDIPYIPLTSSSLDIVVINNGETTLQTRDTLVEAMDEAGYRPLEFSELIALATLHPVLNELEENMTTYKKYSFDGVVKVPSLHCDGKIRSLVTFDTSTTWDNRYRFMFVRK